MWRVGVQIWGPRHRRFGMLALNSQARDLVPGKLTNRVVNRVTCSI